MSHPLTSQFLEGIQSSRLLDDARLDELRARPEAMWGDVASLANFAQERGWLTPYQTLELREGRGDRLTVHGYQIFDKIDEGPHGATFKAQHPALQQPVSLRLLSNNWLEPADNSADYIARVRAASLAQSPHLANILDAGGLDAGPFVVQEFVDGCDLFRLVNEMGALPVGLACEYVRQAAIALKAAHEKGVAHGEVSPHSLLLTPVKRSTGSNGDVSIRPRAGASIKLTEFGLTPRRPPVSELTFGQTDRLGPVAFFPPERLTSGEKTPAGDMYGLGGTLYFLLTTRPPHLGESPLAVLLSLQQAEPPALDTLKSDVATGVSDLVQRLLSRYPTSRPTAAEVVDALLPYCEASAMPISTPDVVLAAHETFTQPAVPTAVPVARDLDRPETAQDAEPFAEPIDEPMAEEIPPTPMPTVEPMPELHASYNGHGLVPEIQPLDEHHHDDHEHGAFGHTAMGADKPRAPKKRAKATPKQKMLIGIGLALHLTATTMCLSWLGWIPNPFAKKAENPPIEKKDDTTTKTKPKKK
jgi:serine/threonine protein kinase